MPVLCGQPLAPKRFPARGQLTGRRDIEQSNEEIRLRARSCAIADRPAPTWSRAGDRSGRWPAIIFGKTSLRLMKMASALSHSRFDLATVYRRSFNVQGSNYLFPSASPAGRATRYAQSRLIGKGAHQHLAAGLCRHGLTLSAGGPPRRQQAGRTQPCRESGRTRASLLPLPTKTTMARQARAPLSYGPSSKAHPIRR